MQLPWAGVEPYVGVIRAHADRIWTCAKGVYAEPVAELALTLLLAGLRRLDEYGRATTWGRPLGRNLLGARVVLVGGGGITESLLRMLEPFEVDVDRRPARPAADAGRRHRRVRRRARRRHGGCRRPRARARPHAGDDRADRPGAASSASPITPGS